MGACTAKEKGGAKEKSRDGGTLRWDEAAPLLAHVCELCYWSVRRGALRGGAVYALRAPAGGDGGGWVEVPQRSGPPRGARAVLRVAAVGGGEPTGSLRSLLGGAPPRWLSGTLHGGGAERGVRCRVVAFRGTKGACDAVTDVQTSLVDVGGGVAVHGGFWRGLGGVAVDVDAAVAAAEGPDAALPVAVTGHSLGGAMALLAPLQCPMLRARRPLVCTFGAPPVFAPGSGGGGRVTWDMNDTIPHAAQVHCFVNGDDAVPRSLGKSALVGKEYQAVGAYHYLCAMPDGRPCCRSVSRDGVPELLRPVTQRSALGDHMCANYTQRLDATLGRRAAPQRPAAVAQQSSAQAPPPRPPAGGWVGTPKSAPPPPPPVVQQVPACPRGTPVWGRWGEDWYPAVVADAGAGGYALSWEDGSYSRGVVPADVAPR